MAPPSSPPFFSTPDLLLLPCEHWHPATSSVQVEGVQFTILAESVDPFPIIPAFCRLATAPPDATPVVPDCPTPSPPSLKLRILDQGRAFGRQGRLGRGTKLDQQSAPAPPGTPLTYFVCVARGPPCDDTALLALYALLRSHHLGSGQYEALTSPSETLIYDTARSPGYALNNGAYVRDGVSFRSNVSWRLPEDPTDFLIWVTARYSLPPGTHLWISYGSSSSHHSIIRDARNRTRANLPPGPTARRKARKHCCDAARLAKAAKRTDAEGSASTAGRPSRPSRSSSSSIS